MARKQKKRFLHLPKWNKEEYSRAEQIAPPCCCKQPICGVSRRGNTLCQLINGKVIAPVSFFSTVVLQFIQRNVSPRFIHIARERVGGLGRYGIPDSKIGVIDRFLRILGDAENVHGGGHELFSETVSESRECAFRALPQQRHDLSIFHRHPSLLR